ncbi:MAG: transposase [Dehalococcoidia bacterium]|nr:transposase [Dehalococcoidia bacterium]
MRALLIGSVYNIASFRRLCSAISENIAYRWFCFLTIDDPVFDHSSISHFIDRIGRDGFAAIFEGLNQELLRLGLLSPEMYADASLVKANASSFEMVPSGMTVAEFQELAIEENGLFVLTETSVDDDGVESNDCLPPRSQRRYVSLIRYYPMTLLARERNRTSEYRRERVRRQTIAEGTFASLDRLGWARTRLRGLWKVNCEGYLASFAHNVLKMVRKLGRGVGPPGPVAPADAVASSADQAMDDGLVDAVTPLHCLIWLSCWVLGLEPLPARRLSQQTPLLSSITTSHGWSKS